MRLGITKATSWENENLSWSCVVTVTAEGFEGNGLEYKLIGNWKDGNSYITFNADMSGYMKVYKNSNVVQESAFTWNAYENSYGKYVEFDNCVDYLKKTYTITSISAVSFHLHCEHF